MSDARERDDETLQDGPNEAGFSGGATTPEVDEDTEPEDPELAEAERIAIPGDDLTTAIGEAVSGDARHRPDDGAEPTDRS